MDLESLTMEGGKIMNHQLESKLHNKVANKPLETPSIQYEQVGIKNNNTVLPKL